MKTLICLLILACTLSAVAQRTYSEIHFSRRADSQLPPRFVSAADSALLLMAAVYNSQEFRDTLATFQFPCRNYVARRCPAACRRCQRGLVDTQTILDTLYRISPVSLSLRLDEGGGGEYGHSEQGEFVVTSHYQTVNEDAKMPFSYHYAVHLCHEYMHIRGFYHSGRLRRRVDIAEQTGEIAYVILLRWYRAGYHPF